MKTINSKADLKYTEVAEYLSLVKEGEDIDLQFLLNRMMKIFYGLNPSDVRQLSQKVVNDKINDINKALDTSKSEFSNIIEMGGVKYGFLPNFSEISAGELIDIEDLYKEDRITELMSILYRPIVGKINKLAQYEVESYKGYDNRFKDISYDIVEGAMALFMQSFLILNHLIRTSTAQQMMMNPN